MNKLIRVGMDALEKSHWDGTGCGTHGSNACVYCYGPSPMSSYEVAEIVINAVKPFIDEPKRSVNDQLHEAELVRDSVLSNLRDKVKALYSLKTEIHDEYDEISYWVNRDEVLALIDGSSHV